MITVLVETANGKILRELDIPSSFACCYNKRYRNLFPNQSEVYQKAVVDLVYKQVGTGWTSVKLKDMN